MSGFGGDQEPGAQVQGIVQARGREPAPHTSWSFLQQTPCWGLLFAISAGAAGVPLRLGYGPISLPCCLLSACCLPGWAPGTPCWQDSGLGHRQ